MIVIQWAASLICLPGVETDTWKNVDMTIINTPTA
jgi:hypothetical protein